MGGPLPTLLIVIFFFSSLCDNANMNYDEILIEDELVVTLKSIQKVLNFMEGYSDQLNLDAFFGITLAQAQIEQALLHAPQKYEATFHEIRERCQNLLDTYRQRLQYTSTEERNSLFKKVLLHPKLWHNSVHFTTGALEDYGLHSNWIIQDVIRNKSSSFRGLASDQCLAELLENNCIIGDNCRTMMLENRNDTLYLLTHRLLFMQLARGLRCSASTIQNHYTKHFCSLIWRDAKTIEYLGFPNMDIFLEEVLLCGMEGYEEFFIARWRKQPIAWQTKEGCYIDFPNVLYRKQRRSANVIEFGCVDHTTGLGLATLAINARYLIYTMRNL